MKKLISFILVIIFALSFMAINVSASCNLSISFSSKEVFVGDQIKVTFSFSASAPVESADVTVQFDNAKFQYVSTSGGLGNLMPNQQGKTIKISDYGTGATSKTYKITMTFKALAVGSGTFSVTSSDIGDAEFNSLGAPTGSATASVKEENKSNNANLKWLTVPSGCKLVPAFNKNTTSYTCTVPYSVTSFPMDWDEEDKDATSTVTKLQTLKVGENSRTVTVTAPDGTKKSYTVKVIREEAKETPVPSSKPDVTQTPTPTPTPTAAPITVTIGENQYTVSSAVTLILPENFKKEIIEYNSYQVETAVLGNVRLMQLFDGSRDQFYLYDSVEKTFSPYRNILTKEKGYIILDKKPELSIELKEEHIVIGSGEYIGWSSERFGEGYYLLNVVNNEGINYSALYCKEDGSIQKLSMALFAGDAVIESATPALTVTPTPTEPTLSTPLPTEANGFLEFIKGIEPGYIGLAVCALLLLIIIIVIIVLVVKNNKERKPEHDWGFEEDNSFNFVVEDVEEAENASAEAPVSAEEDTDSDFE